MLPIRLRYTTTVSSVHLQASQMMPPIRVRDRLSAVAVYHPSNDDSVTSGGDGGSVQPPVVFDFGQNFAGWVEVLVTGSPLQSVRPLFSNVCFCARACGLVYCAFTQSSSSFVVVVESTIIHLPLDSTRAFSKLFTSIALVHVVCWLRLQTVSRCHSPPRSLRSR